MKDRPWTDRETELYTAYDRATKILWEREEQLWVAYGILARLIYPQFAAVPLSTPLPLPMGDESVDASEPLASAAAADLAGASSSASDQRTNSTGRAARPRRSTSTARKGTETSPALSSRS